MPNVLSQIKNASKRKSLSPQQKHFLRELYPATKEFLDDFGEKEMDFVQWEGIAESYSLSKQEFEEVKGFLFSDSQIPTSPKSEKVKSKKVRTDNSQIPTSQQSDSELLEEYNQQLSILKDRVRGVVGGFATGAYFYGLPGISKTHTVLQTLKDMNAKFVHERGKLTPPALFELIEENHDRIIVLDDVSSIFEKADALQIFLAALDANKFGKRIVSYKISGISRRVVFSGGIIALSNLTLEMGGKSQRILQAIRDRIHPLKVNPTTEQIFALMRDIASKGHDGIAARDCKTVCSFLIEELKRLQLRPSMRTFIDKALKDFRQWKAGKSQTHWQDLIRSTLAEEMVSLSQPQTDISRSELIDSERRLAAEICFDYDNKELRLLEWEERTGKSQSAFYRRKKEAENLGLIR